MFAKIAWGNVRKSISDFGIYFLTVVLGVTVFYAFNATADMDVANAIDSRALLAETIRFATVLVTIVFAFLILYANSFLIRRRKREFGLYLALGMRTSQVALIAVLETVMVGAASVVCGLAAGWLFSQVLVNIAANIYNTGASAALVGVSLRSVVRTLVVFGALFVLSSLMNAVSVSRTTLIDLMKAGRTNQEMKLRSLPLSVVLFAVAIGLIGLAYKLLLDTGLDFTSPNFLASTVIVCVGTWLFFYSISGFLLRFIQSFKGIYLNGLNMFTLRQINSRINGATATMTMVCMTLFFALICVCGGIGITTALNSSLQRTTSYDATLSTQWGLYLRGAYQQFTDDDQVAGAQAAHWDMKAYLDARLASEGQMSLASLAASAQQIDTWIDPENPLTFEKTDKLVGDELPRIAGLEMKSAYKEGGVPFIKLSEVNAVRSQIGREPLDLKPGTCLAIGDTDYTAGYFRLLAEKGAAVEVGSTRLIVDRYINEALATEFVPMQTGAIVIPDEALPASAVRLSSSMNIMRADGVNEKTLGSALELLDSEEKTQDWGAIMIATREAVQEQGFGLNGIVAFLAIYIGFALVIACAGILAIQQLTEASDNAQRYRMLRRLGVDNAAIDRSLAVQVVVYFLFPMALAVCHTVCALNIVDDLVRMFGIFNLEATALIAAAAFVATYGAYALLTWIGARSLTSERSEDAMA